MELSSLISHFTCSEMSSRFRSVMYQRLSRMLNASRLTVLLLSSERLAWRRRGISFRRSDGQFDGGI